MNEIDERIKQCELEIEALKEQRDKLLKEKNKPIFNAGDIVEYLGEKRLIVIIMGKKYAVNEAGRYMSTENTFSPLGYSKIGVCGGFNVV